MRDGLVSPQSAQSEFCLMMENCSLLHSRGGQFRAATRCNAFPRRVAFSCRITVSCKKCSRIFLNYRSKSYSHFRRKRPSDFGKKAANALNVSERLSDILLVEDDAAVRRLISEWLRRSGYQAVEASSGPDAIRCFAERKGRISLVLTDVDLGEEISGMQLADHLESISPDLRVIIMSGSPTPSTKRHFISKPFARADLLRKIEEVLGSAATTAGGTEKRVAVDRRYSGLRA